MLFLTQQKLDADQTTKLQTVNDDICDLLANLGQYAGT